MSEAITIVLVDDDPLVRVGLRAVLDAEDDLSVVGEAGDGRDAIATVAELAPDVVIMDIRMPNLDGLAATRHIVEKDDAPRILVLTTFELDEYVYEALQAGAAGFLLKRVPPAELIEAVRIVATGESLVFPAVTRRLIAEYSRPDPTGAGAKRLEMLTERERDVLALMAKGRSNAEIGDELYVGRETVKSHVKSVLLKLGVRDRTQAVITAYETGFVRPGASDP
jgi:DNA-binding NarL/FixJ family response regulator